MKTVTNREHLKEGEKEGEKTMGWWRGHGPQTQPGELLHKWREQLLHARHSAQNFGSLSSLLPPPYTNLGAPFSGEETEALTSERNHSRQVTGLGSDRAGAQAHLPLGTLACGCVSLRPATPSLDPSPGQVPRHTLNAMLGDGRK